ncbi:MAG: SpoIID/LytB domain-containing protein [Acutalibacteraceae bacterium]
MIKLLTLENLSAFSSDAVYKICLSLERFGMTDESILSYPNDDALFYAADTYLSAGDEVIVAAEPNCYNSMKKDLLNYLSVDSYSCPEIAQCIAMNSGIEESDFDVEAMCTVAENSVYHLSDDGLYSGFSVNALNGRLTVLPLDFARLDSILLSLVDNCLDPKPTEDELQDYTADDGQAQMIDTENPYDFSEPVSKMVYSLMQLDRRLAIATGEATMWIYNLYDKIDGLSDVVNFVEIIDDEEIEEPEEADETAQDGETEETEKAEEAEIKEDVTDLPDIADTSDEDQLPQEETQQESSEPEASEPKEKESVSAKTIRFAREAMRNTESDFGAAISDVYTSENEDGTTNYFAFVAIADKKGAKAKKINTLNYEDAKLLLPHCITVLSETVCQKVDAISASLEIGDSASSENGSKGEEKKLSKGMIAFAVIIFAIAIISPIIILTSIASNKDPGGDTTTLPFNQVMLPTDQLTTAADIMATTADIFGTSAQPVQETSNPIFAPMEPTAADVSVITTTPPVSSTSGTFTFYVFGYGHGVGLSQTGANALAAQGWSFAQILANYYYGATLVSGDTYPEKINYSGSDYTTREYLAGALYAEMGDSFNNEALKAQAIAIYTFAKYYGYKVDSSGTAYKTGASEKIYGIVDDIIKNGFYIAYNGQTALTPFHATSAGVTTSYKNAWPDAGVEVLYLAGGRPSPDESSVEDFKTTVTMTSEEFKSLAESKGLGISCSGDPATWISIISHDTAINENIGYVSTINVGGKLMSGNEFRNKVMDGKLRSHCFTVVYTPSAS